MLDSESSRYSIVEGFSAKPPGHTYFIAEAGNNHNGSVEMAKQLIDVAVEAGADGVKFQKRDVNSMLTADGLDRPFNIPGADEWGNTYRQIREHIELSVDQMAELKDYCQGKIDFLVTPFDLVSTQELLDLGIDAFKIAAFTVTDLPVLEMVATSNKPVFLSAGMCTDDEISRAVEIFTDSELILLHCISSYPMKVEDANLRLIQWLQRFECPVGWSDHEIGITLAPVAVALGAQAVEKHYTLNRALPGFDHAMSLEPTGLKKVVRNIRNVEKAMLGLHEHREILPCELKAFDQKRRTVVATQDIKQGDTITREMLTTKAPNRGLPPRFIPDLVGKEALEDIRANSHITFSMVKF